MKYGDTLRQRSIPEWGHCNIDYDSLKDLIKHHTTPGTGKAVSIPGQGETSEKAFGETFFQTLKSQHDRINLFIRSKSGEIERRLEYILKTLAQLQARQPSAGPDRRLPVKTIEKYAKIDADVLKAGNEIQSLARFRAAQRTGFYKILKKYKRWTKDPELERSFKEKATDSPESFFQMNLGYLLDQYYDAFESVRAPLEISGASRPSTGGNPSWSISRISQIVQNGPEIDFDLALSTTPLGSRGSKATYWIHPDNIIQVEVLLLQQMRLYTGANATSASTAADTPIVTPGRRKSSATVEKCFGSGDATGLLVLDHPESFAVKQNASTIGSNEETPGAQQARAAGTARWSSSGDAVVIVGLESTQGSRSSESMRTARLKRKNLEVFLNTAEAFADEIEQGSEQADVDTKQDSTSVRQWLREHKSVTPIAGICTKRTRFEGRHNNPTGGMWATLDRDVFMKDALLKDLKDDAWLSEARNGAIAFPHAILEIRREGSSSSSLIHALDKNYLVERVRGFSYEAHAVWMCCKPRAMSAPLWMALLDKDIRKLPPPVKRQRRRVTIDSPPHSSPAQTSTSATPLTDGNTSPHTGRNGDTSATSASEFVEPPPLQAFRKKSRRLSELRRPSRAPAPAERQGYWNEYDHPESEDEGYYIYVDPNASVEFPGQKLLQAWTSMTMKLFGIRKAPDEESPLLSPTDYVSSDDETADESPTIATTNYGSMAAKDNNAHGGGYFSGLFGSRRDPYREVEALNSIRRQTEFERHTLVTELRIRRHKTEMTKLRFYSTCLLTGLVVAAILGTMTITSKKKDRGIVDGVVLFGTIFNLLLCITAVTSMMTRKERLGWVHQGLVLTIVCGLVVVDVFLLRWVFNWF